ncbi:acid phosphatase [Roseomonas elaeocarpi]|uniref:Acid phosphatase n=1 Tax=Roseomonas elaeocarpi TaxID=907779 RepID=A0ABV6JWY5_9PROT
MSTFRRSLLAAAASLPLLAALPVLAEDAPYVTAADVNFLLLLPPPPARNSALDQAEIAQVLEIQRSRSPERAALAVHDATETPEAMFGTVMGPDFTAAKLPLTIAFLAHVAENEDVLTDPAKKGFGRPRPHLVNAEIKPIVPLSTSGSYPSGHTTRGTMTGIVLAAMVPERHDAILARVQEYGQSRLVGGIHYASDIEAGYRAGTAAAAVMMTKPAFQADFAKARAELRAALGLQP